MDKTTLKQQKRSRRHARIRARVMGTPERPRLAVFRSNTAVYAQLIDDVSGKTLAAVDSRKVAGERQLTQARVVGEQIAAKAKQAHITTVVFDRGGFLYAGAIKELADGARAGGLQF